jgi:hypothetical protein
MSGTCKARHAHRYSAGVAELLTQRAPVSKIELHCELNVRFKKMSLSAAICEMNFAQNGAKAVSIIDALSMRARVACRDRGGCLTLREPAGEKRVHVTPRRTADVALPRLPAFTVNQKQKC